MSSEIPFDLPFFLVCPNCGARHTPGTLWWGCASCRDTAGFPHYLEVGYDMGRVDAAPLSRPGRLWDYRALLPLPTDAEPVTLGEGGTPLVRSERLNRDLGLPNLYLKLETVNPTGSFKDRYQTVTLSAARALGLGRAGVITTTGNAGVACAAYAAAAEFPLLIITDPLSSPEQRRLMRLFGARITVPTRPGPVIEQGRALTEVLVREHSFFPCSVQGTYAGPGNPYGVEGYKTIAFEVFAQLGGRVPDRVCVPTAGGDALYGPFKGFRELRALGLTDRLPRMTACQSNAAGFIAPAMRAGADRFTPVDPHTFAISIGDPTGSLSILTALRDSDGDAWEASDAELLDTVALLGRCGICAEGASAAGIAALRHQRAAGVLDPDEVIVAVICGTGMKWPAQIDAAIGDAESAPPLPDDIPTLLAAIWREPA
jgi:threonine synthase